MLKLYEEGIIDPELGFHFGFFSSIRDTSGLHEHDFYEIFITYGGSVHHLINGGKDLLQEGTLVFIRPWDRHAYEKLPQNDCQIMNVAFSAGTMEAMNRFLGPSRLLRQLIECQDPPKVILSAADSGILKERFHQLAWSAYSENGKPEAMALFKATLTDVLYRHFTWKQQESTLSMPPWLDTLQALMRKKENFSEGLAALHRLCPKSPEHVSRSLKRFLGITPTEWINGFRLQYAASLLHTTDAEIIEVAMEAGFDNLSHFYHLFKKKYGQTPAQYRQSYKKAVIPD